MDNNTSHPVFRAAKRRKIFRKKSDTEAGPAVTYQGNENRTITDQGADDEAALLSGDERAVNIPRRKLAKYGIGYSTQPRNYEMAELRNTDTAMVVARSEQTPAAVAQGRFVAPTGRVGPVEDKHMMAYVDLKLANLRASSNTADALPSPVVAPSADVASKSERTFKPDLRNAALGKILEVDLGTTSSQRNANRTVAAQRLAASGKMPSHPSAAASAVIGKTRRLLRNQQLERTETDVARDSLVDQILRESHMPIYEREASPSHHNANDTGTDEAFAEAFRQEFMAAIEEKNLRAKPPLPPGAVTKGGKVVEVAKGPKLGGSRAQRERMKAAEEEKARAGKKK